MRFLPLIVGMNEKDQLCVDLAKPGHDIHLHLPIFDRYQCPGIRNLPDRQATDGDSNFMTTALRHIILLALAILLQTNGYGQTNKPVRQDTAMQQQPAPNRQSFWDSLPKPTGWINDYEGLYSDDEELVLDSLVHLLKAGTGIEIVVVTLDSACIPKEQFVELTLRMANQWGVGEAGKDNGILVGISRGHRMIRINNGSGIEKLITDEVTKEIIDSYFIPYFKAGEFYKGTIVGLTELIQRLQTKR